ncbi:MAG: zinc-binding alcohol dehydrogenase family protein [Bacteroidales bacterium]|jgi:threonine dehydrogenase-like Zn-dependent dehydrogenase|nr:zinc-binding alcohol dehydrogenase family protein [Bacteroidales bacterium]
MKAIQIIRAGEVRLVDVCKPVPAAGETLVRIKYAGFCGSDLNTYLGKNPMARLPVIPGHEIGAVIEAVGENTPESLKAGMSCTINPYTACGDCPSCRNGRPNACRHNRTLGVQRDGAMCEYLAVPWEKVIADEQIPCRDFCLVEPMSVGFHAVSRAAVTDSDTVMVVGCGMIGVGAVVRSALRGAKTIAVDMDDDKLALAGQLGAAYVINSQKEDVHERMQSLTSGAGADVVIEAVGASATYRMAVEEVAFTGRIACIGYAKAEIAFDTKWFVQKELDIRGSRNAMPADFRAVMKYLKRGNCPVEKLITGIYPPSEAQVALDAWKANPAKVFRILISFDTPA